jgi:high affinity Mn2+ porin
VRTLPQALRAYVDCLHAPHPATETAAATPAAPAPARKEEVAGGEEKSPPAGGQAPTAETVKADTTKNAEAEPAWYSAHAQATMVTQVHNTFPSPYMGPNSLLPSEPSATSLTATLFLDFRLWEADNYSAELVFNPEISGGRGFSMVTGLAGFSNEEISRVGVVDPTPYIARLYLRQTWGLGGEREKVEDLANQISGVRDICRVTLSVGKIPPTDVVDDNRYSHDPRTSFLNWALVYNGAWDYPANVRGYNYGVAVDLNTVYWAVRYGIFPEPATANGAPLDPHFLKANGQILELEERWWLVDRPGKVREWVYLNRAHMGDYQEALQAMPVNPDVTMTRDYRYKYGFGASFEQEITRDLGVFARLGWNDGHTETWAFTAIDRTVAGGLVLNGTRWCRPHDQVGLAGIINGIAADHRAYLAAGGLDFIIGDGRLRYAPEQILEMFYNIEVHKGIFVMADFQEVNHPAYNSDRGPVSIGTLRVHIEF